MWHYIFVILNILKTESWLFFLHLNFKWVWLNFPSTNQSPEHWHHLLERFVWRKSRTVNIPAIIAKLEVPTYWWYDYQEEFGQNKRTSSLDRNLLPFSPERRMWTTDELTEFPWNGNWSFPSTKMLNISLNHSEMSDSTFTETCNVVYQQKWFMTIMIGTETPGDQTCKVICPFNRAAMHMRSRETGKLFKWMKSTLH